MRRGRLVHREQDHRRFEVLRRVFFLDAAQRFTWLLGRKPGCMRVPTSHTGQPPCFDARLHPLLRGDLSQST